MCATLSMLSLYYALYKTENPSLLILSAIIYFFLYTETETRGPLIGIIIVIIYLAFIAIRKFKNMKYYMLPFLILSMIILAVMTTHHPLTERIKGIGKINFIDPMKTHDMSLRERIYYIKYSMEEVNERPITGIGPQNVHSRMLQKIKEQKLTKITPRDHVHNEFFDIVLKFGFMSLILLFQIYFLILNNKNRENHILINILMIMFISSQLFQSQFAHHQAITFFLGLLYILQPKTRSQSKVE
jgi:O-antigen ligase